MKIWALVLLVGVCATIHAGPIDQRSAARDSFERNLQKLSDFSAENDLYTLFSADQKVVPVNIVLEDEVKTLGEQLTKSVNFEDSFENTIDADEEHSKFKRDVSHEENVDKDETSLEDPEIENTRDHTEEDLDSEEAETERVKRDLEDEDDVLPEYSDDWPRQIGDGRDENMVERNLHDAVEDWSDDLVEEDQFIVSEDGTDRVKRDLEKENDVDSMEEDEKRTKDITEEQDLEEENEEETLEEDWMKDLIEEQDDDKQA